jgi:hypothetical protein
LRINRIVATAVIATVCAVLLVFVVLVLHFANVFRSWGLGSSGAYDQAFSHWKAGDADATLHWCAVAIRRDPQWRPPYELRAKVLESRGQLELAIHDYVHLGKLQGRDSTHYRASINTLRSLFC